MRIKCPKCSKVVLVTPKIAGRKAKCGCGTVIKVPPLSPEAVPVAATPVAATPVAAAPQKIQVDCPSCRRQLAVPASAIGKLVNCPCGAKVPVTKAATAPQAKPLADPFSVAPPQPVYDQFAHAPDQSVTVPHRYRTKADEKPTAIEYIATAAGAAILGIVFLIFMGVLLFQRVPKKIPAGLRGEDYTNAYLAQHPEYTGGIFFVIGLIPLIYGIVGLRTGVIYTKFGQRVTGYSAKAGSWLAIGLGVILLMFGGGSIVKAFLV